MRLIKPNLEIKHDGIEITFDEAYTILSKYITCRALNKFTPEQRAEWKRLAKEKRWGDKKLYTV